MDLTQIIPGLADLQAWAAKMADLLKAGRVAELLAEGETIVCRPAMFPMPPPLEKDPVFGLTGADWRKFRKEGFDGWQETTPGSGKPKTMIHVGHADKWLEARRASQHLRRGAEGPGLAERLAVERWQHGPAETRPGRRKKEVPAA